MKSFTQDVGTLRGCRGGFTYVAQKSRLFFQFFFTLLNNPWLKWGSAALFVF